jgi:hypothetical protein
MTFDHHFFHMCGVSREKERLFLPEEKTQLLSIVDGFGEYKLAHNGARGRSLPSAYDSS